MAQDDPASIAELIEEAGPPDLLRDSIKDLRGMMPVLGIQTGLSAEHVCAFVEVLLAWSETGTPAQRPLVRLDNWGNGVAE